MDTSRLRSSSAPPADVVPAAGSVPSPAATANLGSADQMVTRAPAAASATGQMVAGGALRIDHAGNLLRLAGDMDAATYAGLVAALDRFAGEPGDIHIDLSGVDFCDVASLRALSSSATPAANTPISPAGVSSCTSPRPS